VPVKGAHFVNCCNLSDFTHIPDQSEYRTMFAIRPMHYERAALVEWSVPRDKGEESVEKIGKSDEE